MHYKYWKILRKLLKTFDFPCGKNGVAISSPIALRTAKTPLSFGCSECNSVKHIRLVVETGKEYWTVPFLITKKKKC